MLKALLDTDLQRLGILAKSFATQNLASQRLKSEYGPNRGALRFQALVLLRNNGRRQVAQLMGISLYTLNDYIADIKKAGLPPTYTEADEPLPPLESAL